MLSKLPLSVALTGTAAQTTQPAPELTLARLDCGTPVLNIVARVNDTWAFTDNKVMFTFSCYLIKRGDDYMLWDTGQVASFRPGLARFSEVMAAK
jgi:N-acyl homoserine lactone hydrolase